MSLEKRPKRYRFPLENTSQAIWSNDSFRDIREHLQHRGIDVSHETIELGV